MKFYEYVHDIFVGPLSVDDQERIKRVVHFDQFRQESIVVEYTFEETDRSFRELLNDLSYSVSVQSEEAFVIFDNSRLETRGENNRLLYGVHTLNRAEVRNDIKTISAENGEHRMDK